MNPVSRTSRLAPLALLIGILGTSLAVVALFFPTTPEIIVCQDGVCGPEGPPGAQGPDGNPGECGPEGIRGEDGECGPEGPGGPPGAQGPQGECGPVGPEGAPGLPGADGVDGVCGPAGPQGIQGTQGIQGVAGEIGPPGPKGDRGERGEPGITTMGAYGSFYSTPGQQVSGTSGSPMLAPLVFAASGVSMTSGGSIAVTTSGVYNIQFSAQFWRVDKKQNDVVDVWLMKKPAGSTVFENVANTNTEITLPERMDINERAVYGWNFMIPIAPGEEVRLMWYSNDRTATTSVINGDVAKVNPDRPAVPPVLLTVHQVG